MQLSIDFFSFSIKQDPILKYSNEIREKVLVKINEIWCLTSLTHDLAYPISSIGRINTKINSILPYFGKFIKQDFNLEKSIVQKEIIDKMIRIISSDIFFTNDNFQAKQVLKHDLYLSLYDSIENNEHGVLSSYLIFKNLYSLMRTPFYEMGSEVHHDDKEVIIFLSNQTIIKSIALHTCKFKRFLRYPSFESLLVLSDEIEEFSRWTRATNNRTYINELCKVNIDINEKNIILIYLYDNPNLKFDIERFFKNKCRIFLNLFNEKLIDSNNNLEKKNPPNIKIIVNNKKKNPYIEYVFEIIDGATFNIKIKTLKAKPEEIEISETDKIEEYIELI